MPQVQILSRDPDQASQRLLSAAKNISDTLQEKRRIELYKVQLDAMKRNTESEEEKLKYERMKQFVSDAMKLKEIGGGEEAFQILSKVYGDDTMPYMDELGTQLAKAPMSPKGQLQSAQADVLRGFTGQGTSPVSSMPIGDMTEGGGGEVRANPRQNLMTQANIGGVTIANPEAQGELEAAKTYARNAAERASRMPTAEEQKTVGFADAVIRNTDDALSRIDSLKGNVITGTLKRAAVDAQNPIAAGAAVEPLQGDINRLRNIIIYLRSGAQINDQEAARLSQLLQVSGKTTGQIKKDLNEFKADAVLRRALVEGGAPVLQNKQYQSPSMTNTVGRFTIREKK